METVIDPLEQKSKRTTALFIRKNKILCIVIAIVLLAAIGFLVNSNINYNKGIQKLNAGEYAAATGYFEKSIQPGADQYAEKAKLWETSEMFYNSGITVFNNKEYVKCLIEFNRVDPTSPRYMDAQQKIVEAEPLLAEEYLQKAKKYYQNGEYKAAQANINEAYTFNPTSQEISDLKNTYEEKYNIEQEKQDKIRKSEEKALKKSQGVWLGMTQQDVLDSSWGRPYDINKTTTEYGVSEQWCYDNFNYLYFEDGVLTSIQN